MSSDKAVAQCELKPDRYYPGGLKASLPLVNPRGYPLPEATLQVEVEILGAPNVSCWQRFCGSCRSCALSGFLMFRGNLPGMLIASWYALIGDPWGPKRE